MEDKLVAILSDPDVNDELRRRTRPKAMEWLRARVNRALRRGNVYDTFAYPGYGPTPTSFRLVLGEGQRLTAHPQKDRKTFICNGVVSDSLAEALLGGYVAAQLTDEPFDNTFE